MISPVTFAEVLPGSARRVASRARRADRFPALFGLERDANAALADLVVVIVGVGGVGATTALGLAHLQIGELRLVDRGSFRPASLITQPITPALVGCPKATAIARLCKEISPRSRVLAYDGPFQNLAMADLAAAHVLIVAGDNLTLLRDSGQCALKLGIRMIHAAVHGETLTAQCRTFSHASAGSPCPVCLFGPEEFAMMDEERVFSCEGFHNPEPAAHGRALQSTRSLRSLCALSGDLAALQTIKLALGLRSGVEDTLLEVCAYTWRTMVTPIHRNPTCPCIHERLTILRAPRALSDCTPLDLCRAARRGPATGGTTSLEPEGFRWAEQGRCGCAEPVLLHRFFRPGQPVRRCASCRKLTYPQPFYSYDGMPSACVDRFQHHTLRSLGARNCRGVIIRQGQCVVLLTNPSRRTCA
jgi:molybdopterin/thiamine biosynthesis adenylyltransferase